MVTDPRLLDAARTVNEKLADAAIRHAVFLERWENGLVQRLDRLLRSTRDDLMNKISVELARMEAKGLSTTARLTSLRERLVGVNETIRRGLEGYKTSLVDELAGIARTETEFARKVLRDSLRNVPLEINMNLPSGPMLEQLATKTPIHGRLMNDWFKGLETSTKTNVAQQLRIGLTEGEPIRDMARRVQRTMGTTRRHAETIARTSATHVTAQAREATYAKNDDILKGIQWISTLDRRTSEICQARDQQVYPPEKGPRPPAHPRCRSTTAPVLKSWEELGIPAKEMKDSTRASMNGQVAANTDFQGWLKKQPPAVQTEILGPSKAAIFQRGKLTVRDFVDLKSGKPLSVDEIRKLEGLVVSGKKTPAPKLVPQATKTTPKARTATVEPTRAEMRASMKEYQSGAYGSDVGGFGSLQNYLRTGQTEFWGTKFPKSKLDTHIHRIDAAIKSSPLKAPKTVYRGVGEWQVQLGALDDIAKVKPGYRFTDAGYTSTSTSQKVVKKRFLEATVGKNPAKITIQLEAGQPAFDMAEIAQAGIGNLEKEFVLPRGTTFEVVSIRNQIIDGKRGKNIVLRIVGAQG